MVRPFASPRAGADEGNRRAVGKRRDTGWTERNTRKPKQVRCSKEESMAENLFDLTGKVAIVTGTSRGLGQYIGRALARAGADLVITSRNVESAAAIPRGDRGARAAGAAARAGRAGLRQHPGAWRAAAMAHYGKIDILVNNAGCNVRKPALDVTWDDWNMVLDTNLRGTFFVSQAVARLMIPARLRPHHQHRLGHERLRLRRARPLRRQPRRDEAADDEPGGRLGAARDHGELPRPGLVQDRAERGAVRRPGVGGVPRRTASRSSGRASRTTWTARWCSSPRTPASTSPARLCWWTAASRRERRGRRRRVREAFRP